MLRMPPGEEGRGLCLFSVHSLIRLTFGAGGAPLLSLMPPAGPLFHRTWRAIEARRFPMGRIGMSVEITQLRRGFFGAAAMAVAATHLGLIGPARAQRV